MAKLDHNSLDVIERYTQAGGAHGGGLATLRTNKMLELIGLARRGLDCSGEHDSTEPCACKGKGHLHPKTGKHEWFPNCVIAELVADRVGQAAIMTSDGKVWSVPRPGRHDAVFKLISRAGYESPYHEVHGFITERDGVFLTRAQALRIARASGQLKKPLIGGGILTSEDLW